MFARVVVTLVIWPWNPAIASVLDLRPCMFRRSQQAAVMKEIELAVSKMTLTLIFFCESVLWRIAFTTGTSPPA